MQFNRVPSRTDSSKLPKLVNQLGGIVGENFYIGSVTQVLLKVIPKRLFCSRHEQNSSFSCLQNICINLTSNLIWGSSTYILLAIWFFIIGYCDCLSFQRPLNQAPPSQAWRLSTCWSRCSFTTRRTPGCNRSRGLTVITLRLFSQVGTSFLLWYPGPWYSGTLDSGTGVL